MHSAHLNFTMISGKKLILFFKNNFTRINHCKFIHHRSHEILSQLPSMYSVQGIFQHHFICKKVHIILDKIRYVNESTMYICCIHNKNLPQMLSNLSITYIEDGLAPSNQTIGSLLRTPGWQSQVEK